jgi:hypothetical protein
MSKAEQREGILIWRKSSHSVANGACVEAAAVSGTVTVRDTANRADSQLRFSVEAWQEFTARVKRE